MKQTVLIVDDEPGVRTALGGVLRDEGYDVEAVESGEAVSNGSRGARTSRRARRLAAGHRWPRDPARVCVSARWTSRSCSSRVTATSNPPFARSRWARSISSRSRSRSRRPCSSSGTRFASGGSKPRTTRCGRSVDRQHTMVGDSHAMVQLREQVAMAAPTNGRVLIYGENGTGKELVARTIHAHEPPRAGDRSSRSTARRSPRS